MKEDFNDTTNALELKDNESSPYKILLDSIKAIVTE